MRCEIIIKINIYIFIIMENANSLTSALIQSKSSSPTILSTAETSSGDSGFFSGIFESIQNINVVTWVIIFLILAFVGFNIFVYLAKGTQDITNFFDPVIKMFFGTAANVTGKTVNVSAEGGKAVVNTTASAVDSGLTAVQDITAPSSLKSQSVKNTIPQKDPTVNTSLNKALNASQSQTQSHNDDYEAHEASGSYTGGKAGWCYIGEDRGHRSCSKVGANDTCMSGDIFPSQELCVNPNLRS